MSTKTVVDLHLHSNYSDGENSIRELILLVRETALQRFGDLERLVISIPDHDNLAGQKEALEYGRTFNVEIIPGVEVTTMKDGQIVHVPTYFSPSHLEEVMENKEVSMILKRNLEIRREKDRRIIRGLRKKDYKISIPELELVIPRNSVGGTPYIVKVLLRKYPELEEDVDDIFAIVYDIERKSRNDASLSHPDLTSVTKILRRARIVPVLGHPLRSDLRKFNSLKLAFTFGSGLGFERYYPYHRFKKTRDVDLNHYQREIDEFCIKYNLVRTGGSDYHGNNFGDRRNLFDVEVPARVADDLLEKIEDAKKEKI